MSEYTENELNEIHKFCDDLYDLLLKKEESEDELTEEEFTFIVALDMLKHAYNDGIEWSLAEHPFHSCEETSDAFEKIGLDRVAEIFNIAFSAVEDMEYNRPNYLDDDEYSDYCDDVREDADFSKLDKELGENEDDYYVLIYKYARNNIAPFKYAKKD